MTPRAGRRARARHSASTARRKRCATRRPTSSRAPGLRRRTRAPAGGGGLHQVEATREAMPGAHRARMAAAPLIRLGGSGTARRDRRARDRTRARSRAAAGGAALRGGSCQPLRTAAALGERRCTTNGMLRQSAAGGSHGSPLSQVGLWLASGAPSRSQRRWELAEEVCTCVSPPRRCSLTQRGAGHAHAWRALRRACKRIAERLHRGGGRRAADGELGQHQGWPPPRAARNPSQGEGRIAGALRAGATAAYRPLSAVGCPGGPPSARLPTSRVAAPASTRSGPTSCG